MLLNTDALICSMSFQDTPPPSNKTKQNKNQQNNRPRDNIAHLSHIGTYLEKFSL
jgi:hypothetical protein